MGMLLDFRYQVWRSQMSPRPARGRYDWGDPDLANEEKRYEVGYGRPPKQYQFKKGNPGRSRLMRRRHEAKTKKYLTSLDIFAKVLEEKIPVSVGGKRKQITKMEALVQSVVNGAIKGDRAALKLVLAVAPKLVEPPDVEYRITRSTAEDRAIVDQFLEEAKTWEVEQAAAQCPHEPGREPSSKNEAAALEEDDVQRDDEAPPTERRR